MSEPKPFQLKAIKTLLNKKDCICALSTSYGKYLVYAVLPFLVQKSIVIVVVPMNAIIEQQVLKLSGQ